MFSKAEIKLAPKVHKVLKKLGYKWIPEEGEWGLTDYGEAVLIYRNVDEKSKENCSLLANTETYGVTACIGPGYHEVGIPILHWEKIEEVLEKMGWSRFQFTRWGNGVRVDIFLREQHIFGRGKTRQLAVMRSIIKLG